MNRYDNFLIPSILALTFILVSLAGCGAFEVGIERGLPIVEPVSTVVVGAVQPMTPTPSPEGYVPPTLEPTFTSVPLDAYPVPDGLRVAFLQNEQVWLWTAERREAVPLTNEGTVNGAVKISDDGQIVAFVRDRELWMVRSDGSDERPLLSTGALDTIEPGDPGLAFDQFEWVPGTHVVALNTQRIRSGARIRNEDLRLVDADNLEQTVLLPPGEGGQFHYSPDGEQIALVTAGDISLVDADGGNRRDGILTYSPLAPQSPETSYVQPVWAADGSGLLVAIPAPDLAAAEPTAVQAQNTAIWRILANGNQTSLVTSIAAAPEADLGAIAFSPDLRFVAYGVLKGPAQAEPSPIDLWLEVRRLGTEDWQAGAGIGAFYGWAPDSRHLAFLAGREAPQLQIGQWSGRTVPGGIEAGTAVYDFRWVDAEHYFLVVRRDRTMEAGGDGWDLVLADIQGASTILVASMEDSPLFDLTSAQDALAPSG